MTTTWSSSTTRTVYYQLDAKGCSITKVGGEAEIKMGPAWETILTATYNHKDNMCHVNCKFVHGVPGASANVTETDTEAKTFVGCASVSEITSNNAPVATSSAAPETKRLQASKGNEKNLPEMGTQSRGQHD